MTRQNYVSSLNDLWTRATAPRESDAPSVVSTFAGAGGSSLGYHAAGCHEMLAVEWEKHAAECLRTNFSMKVHEGDIADVRAGAIDLARGELDIFDGSPPCQGFSISGKRNLADPRNNLFMEYVRLVDLWHPKVLVMENVPAMAAGRTYPLFIACVNALRNAGPGYTVMTKIVRGDALGGASIRKRLIFLGVRKDVGLPVFPTPTIGYTIREAFEGIQTITPQADLRPSVRAIVAHTPPGKSGMDVTGKGYFNIIRLRWDRPGNTLLKYNPRGGLIHPEHHRFLTVEEMKRLQGFPDQYHFPGTPAQITDRIGNSVMPPVSYRLAKTIRERILQR